MPCHLSTYGTQNKECASLDGTIKGGSAQEGIFPKIFSQFVVLVSCFAVHTLQIHSFVTAALHVVDFAILLCTV